MGIFSDTSALHVSTLAFALCASCQMESPSYSTVHYAINTTVARPTEEPYLELAQTIDGFGGYFCEDGNLVVLITAPFSSVVTTPQLAALIDARTVALCRTIDKPDHAPVIVIRESQYNFLSLRTWRDAIADDIFQLGGVLALGFDYKGNRLIIRVSSDQSHIISDVIALAATKQIPYDAYEIGLWQDFGNQLCIPGPLLTNCFRPVPAGVATKSTPIPIPCTIGSANDRYFPQSGMWLTGFVTASHCILPTWWNNFETTRQPGNSADADERIGQEAVDPFGWQAGCTPGYICRYSDATWIRGDWTGIAEWGTIARTKGWNDPTVDPNNPRFFVWGSVGAVQHMEIHKVGAATNWTKGWTKYLHVITGSTDPGDENKLFLDSVIADLHSRGGDSGAPIFNWWWWGSGGSTVEIMGILRGGDAATGETVYSPWSGVERDLGTFYLRYPYF